MALYAIPESCSYRCDFELDVHFYEAMRHMTPDSCEDKPSRSGVLKFGAVRVAIFLL